MNSIGEVIARLEDLVTRCKQEESPVGYFAALYLDVTRSIDSAIKQGKFEDSKRLETVDLCFASRYFAAIDAHVTGKTASLPWQATFDALKLPGLVVDQHMIGAANAHINYDLAIAVAQACPGRQVYDFKNDFNTLNAVLFKMNNAVNGMVVKIWPPISVLLKLFGADLQRIEDAMMKKERNLAWKYAVRLVMDNAPEFEKTTRELEVKVWKTGVKLFHPPWWLRLLFSYISTKEKGDVAYRIDCLVEKMANSRTIYS